MSNIYSTLNITSFVEEHRFTTCNKQGPVGPTSEDCSNVYKYYKTKVSIGDTEQGNDRKDSSEKLTRFGYSTGIQRWIAPKTGIYT